ncbi:33357_t:CDS:2, partial [Racocetra persica]
EIVKSMKQLEERIIDYRQGGLKEEVEVEQFVEQDCWDCLECCGQKEIKKDKGKTKGIISEPKVTSEQKGESSTQAQIEIPPKKEI